MKHTESESYHLVVIGGGAAGFFGAICAAEQLDPASRVIILEKTSKVLGKVRISGGGRCNVTHACFDPRTFATHFPRGEKALIGPLHHWDAEKTIEWFEDRGVSLKTESDGRMFPDTDDSQTIIDCLTDAANDSNIEIRTRTAVNRIKYGSDKEFPFHIDELVARLRALYRRTSGAQLNIIRVDDLSINLATREVIRGDEEVELTPREFSLLELLARSPGRVYTRIQILESVWSYDFDPNTNLVDVYIKRVRKKVDSLGEPLIETVRGVGYKIKPPS